MTRQTEPISVFSTVMTEARMVVVRSSTMVVLMPCGQHSLEKRQLRLDAIDSLNDVGAGLPEDDDEHRPGSVHVAGRAQVLRRVLDIGDIREADGLAVVIADDQRPIVGSLGDLIVGDDVFADAIVGELAPRLMRVLQAEHRLHAAKREAKALQLGGIDLDAHRRRGAAADAHLSDALNLRELLLQDGGGKVVELRHRVLVRGEADDHDRRIGGIHLAVGGIGRQVGRQIGPRRVDGGLHVAGGAVDVAAQVELHGDVGRCPASSTRSSRVMPAMWLNWRSSGVATEAAMICALAPGRPA